MANQIIAILSVVLLVVNGADYRHATAHAHSLRPSMPHVPAFLQKRSSPCQCSYDSACSCEGALRFMSCIKDGCESGKCKCQRSDGRNHFQKACQKIAAGCDRIGLKCTDDEATCDDNRVGLNLDVRDSQEKDASQDDIAQNSPKSEGLEDENGGDDQTNSKDDADGDDDQSNSKEDLPDGWEKAWSDGESRYYYANRATGESSWTPPPTAARITSPDAKGATSVSLERHERELESLILHEHQLFSKSLIADVMVLSVTIALLTSNNNAIVKHTWSTIDMMIVSFLALAWYHVSIKWLDDHGLKGSERVGMHMAVATFLLLLSSLVSWTLNRRGGDKGTIDAGIFNSIFDHLIIWCFIGVVADVQRSYESSAVRVLFATVGLAVFYAALALFWYYVVGNCTSREWSADSINKVAGVGLAAGIAFWVHMIIAGSYHSVEDPVTSTGFQVVVMNGVSLLWIPVSITGARLVKKLSDQCKDEKGEVKPDMYWKKRFHDTLLVLVSYLPHVSCVLSVSHLIIGHSGFVKGSVEARLALAVLNTLFGVGLIVLCAKVKRIREEKLLSGILVSLGGLMAGTAWGGLLIDSLDISCKGYPQELELKTAIVSFLTMVIFPVYFYCFKPMVDQKILNL